MGNGSDLYPHAHWIHVPDGGGGPLQPKGHQLGPQQQYGHGFLLQGSSGGSADRNSRLFNTDQGSQFTSYAFTDILKQHNLLISIDGKGRAIDNIFVERLWRRVKYEYLYLQRPETCQDLYQGLKQYFHFYNQERLHQSLGYMTPESI